MSLFCSSPLWIDGSISDCAQRKYLNNLIPLASCLISFFLLLVAFALSQFHCHEQSFSGYEPVNNIDFEEEEVSAAQETAASQPLLKTVIGPRVTALEGLILVVDISLEFGIYLHRLAAKSQALPLALLVLQAYLLLLFLGRVWMGVKYPLMSNRFQLHAVLLYTVEWLCTLVIGHAALISKHGSRDALNVAPIIHVVFFTALCLIHFTAPRFSRRSLFTGSQFGFELGKDETASNFSQLTFSWINDLVLKAFRGTIEASDLYPLNYDQTSINVVPGFHAVTATTAPLVWKLFQFFKYEYLKQGAWAALMSFTVFVPAILMRLILEYLESPDSTTSSTTWLYVGGLLVSGFVTSIADCQCEWIGSKIGAKLRTVLISEVYGKVLRKRMVKASPTIAQDDSEEEASSEKQATDGNIVNLISGDANFISFIGANLHLTWVSFPIQTTIATYLLYRLLGPSGIIGVLIMIAFLPLNVLLSKKVAAVQAHVLAASDARIQSSNEVIQNIRTIKYLAWEASFRERVLEKRQLELKRMRTRFIWWSLSATIFHSLPFIVTILTCFFYTVVWGNALGTSTAFPALTLFTVIRIPLDRMADSISFILQARVSVIRIDKFLKERETGKYTQLTLSSSSSVGFEDSTLMWPTLGKTQYTDLPRAQSFQLQRLQVKFRDNALNVICGPSGSGKSSLLLALLGEMELISGKVFVPREPLADLPDDLMGLQNGSNRLSTTAYCPQEAWIMNQSIKANILFGLPLNSQRYGMVLDAVALDHDLHELDQGDNTLAGENGARLSGGQKQRVALARALYSLAKYVILDDCLSAVDSRTANRIFFQGLKGPLMQSRTCIFATHNIRLAIPHCDYVVVLESGQIKGKGTAEELISAGFFSTDIVKAKGEIMTTGSRKSKSSKPSSEINPGLRNNEEFSPTSPGTENLDDDNGHLESEFKPSYAESKSEGAVGWPIIRYYLDAMGAPWYWAIVLLGFAAQQLASLGTNLWIKEWASQYDRLAMKDDDGLPEEVDASHYLGIYAAICLLFALISFLRDGITFFGALKASSQIYERLLHSILHAKLLFFDAVPLGQITNRFSSDVSSIDQSLAPFSISAFQLLTSILMVVILISVVLPLFLLVAVFVCLAYYCVMAVYINSSRDLKRIEAVERSPLYQQLGETISGCVSIRAYRRESMFTAQNRALVDRFNQPYILLCACKEWLTFRIGFLSSLISFMTGAFVVGSIGSINAGAAGLVLTYAVNFTENVMWLVQVYAFIQQNFNSIDRIVEYTKVDQEAVIPPKSSSEVVPPDWPIHGHVRFENYTTRYATELDPVLREISFEVKAGQRVGIVGRTGAGKSTLTLALIRGLEADNGLITIDGIDIGSLTLERLRQIVTVVPQNPTLFDGSLRDNLDPLHQDSDYEMTELLRTVRLIDTANSDEFQSVSPDETGPSLDLDHPATALSQGQRQLLCIARALLRRSRILVLDEATASVDHEADARIQVGLRASVAAGTTVLTIAHRLQTIADYDNIVVLDGGRVVEQGTVNELLQHSGDGAVFRRLCEESGDIEAIKRSAKVGVHDQE